MRTRSLFLSLIPVLAIAATGCAGLSFQSYGSTTRGHSVSTDAHRRDVLANLGEPDSVYLTGDTETFIYKGLRGASYCGIYSTIKRDDTIVVMNDQGLVQTVVPVEAGRGRSFFSPVWIKATYPIGESELLEDPENYSYQYGEKVK